MIEAIGNEVLNVEVSEYNTVRIMKFNVNVYSYFRMIIRNYNTDSKKNQEGPMTVAGPRYH